MSKEQKWLYAFLKNKNTAINYSPRLLDNFKKIFKQNEINTFSSNLIKDFAIRGREEKVDLYKITF